LRFAGGEWNFYVSNANGVDFLVKIQEAMSGYKASKPTKSLRLSGNDDKNQTGNLAPVIPIIAAHPVHPVHLVQPVPSLTPAVHNHTHAPLARNKPATTRTIIPFCESC